MILLEDFGLSPDMIKPSRDVDTVVWTTVAVPKKRCRFPGVHSDSTVSPEFILTYSPRQPSIIHRCLSDFA